MKSSRSFFERQIVKQTSIANNNGYTKSIEFNLIPGVSKDVFISDLKSGSGNELEFKFKALYSSSALAVNNFSIVKMNLDTFSFLDFNNFIEASFERKFSTGLGGTPPNIDFVVEGEAAVVAFESKYLECLNKTKAKFAISYNKSKLTYLDPFWFNLIEEYRGKSSYLDVAQLIKHAIGLINYKYVHPNKEIVLVYLYWTPENESNFEKYAELKKDIDNFENYLKDQSDIIFKSIRYIDFWNNQNDNIQFKQHFERMKDRYFIVI